VAAVLACVALRCGRSPDDDYPYGAKAEYLSAGIEGTMILVAAGRSPSPQVRRLIDPTPVEQLGVGLAVSVVAAAVNGAVAWVLLRAGRSHRSITLQADARHLLTDVWTSVGVLVGVGLVAVTGWEWLDPLVALGVAANIVVAGIVLIRRSVQGLLDASLPPTASPPCSVCSPAIPTIRSGSTSFAADARAGADSCRSTCSYRAT
jgi:cation diffusion facilitator family transporter